MDTWSSQSLGPKATKDLAPSLVHTFTHTCPFLLLRNGDLEQSLGPKATKDLAPSIVHTFTHTMPTPSAQERRPGAVPRSQGHQGSGAITEPTRAA